MFAEGELNYSDSKLFFDYVIKNKGLFIVPMIVFFELFHTLKKMRFFDQPFAHELFIEFCNYPNFKFFDLNMRFFNLFKQIDCFNNLKTSDAIIAGAAFLTKSVLITWDKKMIKNSVNSFTPREFLDRFAK